MDDSKGAIRCWPDGHLFHCLEVGKLNAAGAYNVSLSTETELPDFVFPASGEDNGYGCGTVLGVREEINRGGQTLVSNQPSYDTARWNAAYVRNFMADNGMKGQHWYRCIEILNAVLGGSMETVGTTEITRAMIEG
jgi:hypothetical protein